MSEALHVEVASPERVAMSLPVAGIGYRSLAYLVDLTLIITFWVLLYFLYALTGPDVVKVVGNLSTVARVTAALGLFFFQWVYWTASEVLWRGQTPGKRLLGIRVVKADGSPIGVFESAVRNLLRVVDFLPFAYGLGAIVMLFDPRHRRLGDLAAGTLTLREEAIDLSSYLAKAAVPAAAPTRPLTAAEQELLRSFAARAQSLEPAAREKLAAQLRERYGVDPGAVREDLALPAFVARRKPDWDHLEALLEKLQAKTLAAAQLGDLDRFYRRAASDLARAQAQFSGSDVHRYLNQLTGRAYGRIYAATPDRLGAVRAFFSSVFPAAVRDELGFIGAAAGILGLGTLVGFTTLWLQPGLADLFVPEALQRYVAEHRLWTDAVELPPSELATQILTNNLQVTIGAFALGITGGLGTVLLLLNNGVFLGATLAHCFNGGVGKGLLVFMSAHGFVELSVICICGAAGLIIGHALVVPAERPRSEVLRERSTRAVQLVIGCAPFLAAIGVVEGYVSPGHIVPAGAKLVLGAALGLGFWAYLAAAGRGQLGRPAQR